MCRSLNLYMKYYMCGNILWCIYWECVQAAGVSASHFAAWWGRSQEDEAFSPSPSMLTPYPSRHASTTIWRGVRGGGKGRRRAWPGRAEPCIGFWSAFESAPPSSFFLYNLFPSTLLFNTLGGPTPTPTCCSSSLTKGTISEPHWPECRIAEFFFCLFFLNFIPSC